MQGFTPLHVVCAQSYKKDEGGSQWWTNICLTSFTEKAAVLAELLLDLGAHSAVRNHKVSTMLPHLQMHPSLGAHTVMLKSSSNHLATDQDAEKVPAR